MWRAVVRRMDLAVLASLPLMFSLAPTCDAKGPAEGTFSIHIEKQPLTSGMLSFYEQTGLNPWYSQNPRLAELVTINEVNGNYTAREALGRLLYGTRVEYRIAAEKYIDLRIPADVAPAAPRSLPPGVMIATTVPVPEVLVSGTRSHNSGIAGNESDSDSKTVYGRAQFERSGLRNVGEFLRHTVTANVSTTAPSGAAMISGIGQPINLYGMGANETSVEIDGHRLAGVGLGGVAQQVDLDQIDLSTVERIEVTPGTSTALGGGGAAVAGRVNVVRRGPVAGTRVNVRTAQLTGIDSGSRDVTIDSVFGSKDDGLWLSINGGWASEDAVRMGEENTVTPGRERVARNNPARLGSVSPPMSGDDGYNTRSLDGAPLPGIGSAFIYIPKSFYGDPSQLQAYAGKYSYALASSAQDGGGALATVRPSHDVRSFELAAGSDFDSGISVDAAIGRSRSVRAGEVSAVEDQIPRTRIVPPHAPGNPFDVPVVQTSGSDLGDGLMTAEQISRYARAGVKARFLDAGAIRLEHTWSAVTANLSRPTLRPSDNGFVRVIARSPSYTSDVEETTLQATTPVFARPSGTAHLTLAAGRRKENLADASTLATAGAADSSAAPVPHGSQTVYSLQSQLVVPVLAARADFAEPLLQAEMGLRSEKYEIATDQMSGLGLSPITFHKTTGLLSFSVKPFAPWSFRATAGTGFRPAPLTLLSPSVEQRMPSLPVADPQRGGELLGPTTLVYGGSFNLKPERAVTYKAGFFFNPTYDLRFSADYIWIRKKDVVLGPEDLFFGDPSRYLTLFPSRVTRADTADGTPGPIVRIDSTSINIAQLDVRAVDLALNWRANAGRLGTFELLANGTVRPSYVRRLTPDSPGIDTAGVGNLSAPRYRIGVSSALTRGPWTLGLTGRFTSAMKVALDEGLVADQGGRNVERQAFFDLFLGYSTQMLAMGNARLHVRLDAHNVFRTQPAFDAAEPRYVNRYGEGELPWIGLSFRVED
jgi:outer membrane receptor protein involved in Fe transport